MLYEVQNLIFSTFVNEYFKLTGQLRIGFDAKRAFQNKTGLGNYSRFLMKLILDTNKQNDVFAFSPKHSTFPYFEKTKLQIILPKGRLSKALWRSWGIKHDLKAQKIDVYHGLSNEIPFGLKSIRVKGIVTIHDTIFMRYPSYYSFFDRLIYKYKMKYACNNADLIIAISENTKRDILKYFEVGEEKIEVVYQNCSPIFGTKSSEEVKLARNKFNLQKPYIICVGTIEERKNQLNLVKAFEKLGSNDIELVIIGKGKKYKQSLLAYLKANGLNSVKILSDVGFDDLPSLYQGAIFGTYISEYEGFGIPILEGIQSGLAMLAATGSCLEEAGGKAAHYVDPHNLESIKNGLQKLIEDNTFRNLLINEGAAQLKNFDDKTISGKLNKLYAKVVMS